MKKTVTDKNVVAMNEAYNSFRYTWGVAKNFSESVDSALRTGSVEGEEANYVQEERTKIFNQTNDELARFEALATEIIEEIGTARDDESLYVLQLVKELKKTPEINEFKEAYAAHNSDAEPNA